MALSFPSEAPSTFQFPYGTGTKSEDGRFFVITGVPARPVLNTVAATLHRRGFSLRGKARLRRCVARLR